MGRRECDVISLLATETLATRRPIDYAGKVNWTSQKPSYVWFGLEDIIRISYCHLRLSDKQYNEFMYSSCIPGKLSL